MTKLLLSISALFISSLAMADSTVCVNADLFYRELHTVGGAMPLPGSVIGSSMIMVGNKIIDQESFYGSPGSDVPPACNVRFDDSTKKQVYSDGNPGMGSSVYLIDMTITCSGGPSAGENIKGSVTCTHAFAIVP